MTFEARVVLKRAYMNNTFRLVKRKDKQKKTRFHTQVS
ncbi:hypothetical protein BRLA_c020740 [Brevibacillus laterosporus LMG 15441]|uniref:Uncharacterized protein n=1 Tax=Brevibacillus laterosporus LMG 15441 TaxID=1042163 RepID=A0A075RA26_BRELA|nr:hypothetical protein BRLA_c020740 [Brevibacillus laterosporus LMG 15441]ERM18764.1 hypothetical protein P615_14715 [Brevibacillus laterosporus PE36]